MLLTLRQKTPILLIVILSCWNLAFAEDEKKHKTLLDTITQWLEEDKIQNRPPTPYIMPPKEPIKAISGENDEEVYNKEVRYLAVTKINLPSELNEIEFQAYQNTLDVALSTQKFVVISGSEDILQEQMIKNFWTLKVDIVPKQKNYQVNLRLLHSLDGNKDKQVIAPLQRYNLYTDLRLALYKLFEDATFVDKYKDHLETLSKPRIMSIEVMATKYKVELEMGQKKKREEKLLDKKEEQEEKKREKKQKKPKTYPSSTFIRDLELPTKLKIISNDKEKTIKLKVAQDDDNPPPPALEKFEMPSIKIPRFNPPQLKKEQKKNGERSKKVVAEVEKVIPPPLKKETPPPEAISHPMPMLLSQNYLQNINIQFNFITQNITSEGLTKSSTFSRFLGPGFGYHIRDDHFNPRQYGLQISTGIPTKKDNYEIPFWRSIHLLGGIGTHSEIFWANLKFDYAPLTFVNLPRLGEGFQVYDCTAYWLGPQLAIEHRFGKLAATFSRTIMVNSKIKELNISGTKLSFNSTIKIRNINNLEFNYEVYNLTGIEGDHAFNVVGTSYLFGINQQF